jgi:hypothetical protein
MRRSVLVWVIAGLTCALLVGSLAYWYQGRRPDRVEVCWRTFGHTDGSVGAGPFTLREIKAQEPDIRRVRTMARGRELWASPGCGLGVFVRVGEDRFLGYGLLGGL